MSATQTKERGERLKVAEGQVSGYEQVTVSLGRRSYPILIGEGVLARVGPVLRDVHGEGKLLLVSSPPIFDLFGSKVEKSLQRDGREYTVELILTIISRCSIGIATCVRLGVIYCSVFPLPIH